jgi:hypothetical protein
VRVGSSFKPHRATLTLSMPDWESQPIAPIRIEVPVEDPDLIVK